MSSYLLLLWLSLGCHNSLNCPGPLSNLKIGWDVIHFTLASCLLKITFCYVHDYAPILLKRSPGVTYWYVPAALATTNDFQQYKNAGRKMFLNWIRLTKSGKPGSGGQREISEWEWVEWGGEWVKWGDDEMGVGGVGLSSESKLKWSIDCCSAARGNASQ